MQLRSYSLGQFGKQKVEIDWAYGDYKPNSYFGFRAGEVKTPLGLFNDIQDIDAVHPWALLPQSLYPADNRSFNLAHIGGVAYGGVGLNRQDRFSTRPTLVRALSTPMAAPRSSCSRAPAALRSMILPGPRMASTCVGRRRSAAYFSEALFHPFISAIRRQPSATSHCQWTSRQNIGPTTRNLRKNKLGLAGEFSNKPIDFAVASSLSFVPQRIWYVMGSYRVTDKLTAGSYYSSYLADTNVKNDSTRYSRDSVLSSRYDVNQYFYFKLEGHYINGSGLGFYPLSNPQGLQKITRLLVARVGFTF
jgi:hypothetical protein